MYKCSSCRYQCLCKVWWNSIIDCSSYLGKTKMPRIKNYKGATTLKELTPSLYFSIINVHLADVKFYEILSLPFQDIEKPKCRRWQTHRKTTWKQYTPNKHSLQGAIITDTTLHSLTRATAWKVALWPRFWKKQQQIFEEKISFA